MGKFNYRKLALILADFIIITVSGIVLNYALSLFDGFGGFFIYSPHKPTVLFYTILVHLITGILALFAFGAYSRLWRYFNKKDYLFCLAGITAGFAAGFLILFLLPTSRPRFAFEVGYYMISALGVLLFRFAFKRTFLTLTESGRMEQTERTMIVGAGRAGRMILTEIHNAAYDKNNPSANIEPVCFVDDDTTKLHTKINGVEIIGTTPEIPKLCKDLHIDSIIVAIPSCDEEEKRQILDYCSSTQCKIKVIPYLSELLFGEGEQLITQAKEIKIEDLLGRKPIEFDRAKVGKFLAGKVCLVTGGGGSIGSELVRQIARYNPKQIIIVDIYENNAYDIQQELVLGYGALLNLVTIIASVRDYNKMDKIFREYRPQIVFHAAAHKHVPLMETVPEEAVKNNVIGTFNVATLAEFYKVDKFVMISTDKAVNPTNVMGATKRACEMIIQYKAQESDHTEFVTTRFGNVLGSNGSVIPLFRRQIESGSPVTVTHPDIIRYFMTIPEAVSLVLEAGAMANGGEIFVLDMGAPVKITTLAENLIRMYGKVPYKDVPIVFTGLRPGEKLFEELLMDEEGLQSTANKKIFVGNQIEIQPDEMIRKVRELRDAAEANDSEKTVELLSELVPTFQHKC